VIPLHETASGITFAVKIQPRARRNAIVGELGDALKVALIAPSVDGRAVDDRANEACIEFFADLLDLPRSSVTVASGRSSRNKVIGISGCAVAELRDKLGN
jgi:hypothetical protein